MTSGVSAQSSAPTQVNFGFAGEREWQEQRGSYGLRRVLRNDAATFLRLGGGRCKWRPSCHR